ncbi:hypothetical protein HHI36_004747 [Cryptolaemus montrouzieri]|uniref:BZIP domain-containing protein n=1 Tax=Cryptolaemus montrouzieri TaxID=559131 RepID=A0ABD2NSF7_9CUCU
MGIEELQHIWDPGAASLRSENFDDTEPGPSDSGTGIHSLVTPSHISPVPISSPYIKDLENAQIKNLTKKSKHRNKILREKARREYQKRQRRNMTDSESQI